MLAAMRRSLVTFAVLALLSGRLAWAEPPTRWLDDSVPVQEPASRAVDVQHLDLAVRLDFAKRTVSGTATYRGVVRHKTSTLVLQAVDVDIQQCDWLTGDKASPAAFERDGPDLRFRLPDQQPFTLRIHFIATPRRGLYFVGPNADAPDRPLHAWTQGETDETRHWLPGPSLPDERLTWTVAVTAPSTLVALSNGKQTGRTVQGPLATTTWQMTQRVPLYLLSLAVGPFVAIRHPHPGFPVQTWALVNQQGDPAQAFQALPAMIDFLAQRLGVPFPWPQYGQVLVGDFHFGGMENASLSTLDARAVPDARTQLDWQADPLAVHELAHQWFGDLVTCRSWADAWLNEGFASWAALLWFEHAQGPDRLYEGLDGARAAYFSEAADYIRPIVTDRYRHPDELFDRHTYSKGAWVLHMLRRRLGDEAFFAGLQAWLQRGPASVETEDLRVVFEHASGQPLRSFFQRWLRQPGHPQVTAQLRYDPQAHVLTLEFAQTQKVAPGQPLFDLPIEIAIRTQASEVPQRHTFRLDKALGTFSLPLPTRPEVVEIDPEAAVLCDWQIHAGPDELAAMRDHGSTAEVRLRAVRDLGRDLTSPRTIEALQRALAQDPARAVRAEAARTLGRADRTQVRKDLLTAAQNDKESRVRSAAIQALGELHDPEAWQALVPLAQDQSYDVQKAALRALTTLDRHRARPVLLQALGQKSFRDSVQVTALGLLALLADPADRERLWNATLPGRGEPMREGAAMALGHYAARLEGVREDVRLHLEGMLQDQNLRIRRAVGQGLGVLGDPASRGPLNAAVARELDTRTADILRRQLDGLGRHLPLEERLKRLEEQMERMQREGEKKDAAHPQEPRHGL
jgi:aminopeptidase N